MSTTIDRVRSTGRRSILATVASSPATESIGDQAADAPAAGPQPLGNGLVLLGAAAALARLVGAALLVLGIAVAGTVMMAAKLLAAVVRIALLTWAMGRPGRGGHDACLWP